jgi:hypothetical protein
VRATCREFHVPAYSHSRLLMLWNIDVVSQTWSSEPNLFIAYDGKS